MTVPSPRGRVLRNVMYHCVLKLSNLIATVILQLRRWDCRLNRGTHSAVVSLFVRRIVLEDDL